MENNALKKLKRKNYRNAHVHIKLYLWIATCQSWMDMKLAKKSMS